MADFEVPNDRPFGAVKKTEEELQAVPLPRQQRQQEVPVARQEQQQQAAPNEGSYQRDVLATTPMASLPMDVQNNLHRAKAWYEIAMHPASGEFERALAMAHLNDMDDNPVLQQDEEVKDNKKDTDGKSV